jgi:hypothetical protein
MTSKTLARRGPKTPEGKLAVRFNASTHGILSLQPIVNVYERSQDWENHRQAMMDSLAPEGGMEQLLAERGASCSWRLNRVLLYESETIAASQEGVVEHVRQERKRELEHERIFAKVGEEVLIDMGILMESHPANALEDARTAPGLQGGVQGARGPIRRSDRGRDGGMGAGARRGAGGKAGSPPSGRRGARARGGQVACRLPAGALARGPG